MKKSNSYLLVFILGLISFFGIGMKVEASNYAIDFTAYRMTNVPSDICDYNDPEYYPDCLIAAQRGDLDSYLIDSSNNSNIEKNDLIMIVASLRIITSDSDLQSFTIDLKADPDKLKLLGKQYVTVNELVKGKTDDFGLVGFWPNSGSGRNPSTTWSVATGTDYIDSGELVIMVDSGNGQLPATNDGMFAAMLYQVGEIPAGQKVDFYVDLDSTSASGSMPESGGNPPDITDEFEFGSLSFKTLSTVSTDYTLNLFDVKANAGGTTYSYPFGFVPSSSSNMEYRLIVPNSVTSIDLDLSVNDTNSKGITGVRLENTNKGGFTSGDKTAKVTVDGLAVGDNNVYVTVTSEEGTPGIYKLVVDRLSSDATLSSLTATNGVSFGNMISNKYTYTTQVPYKTTSTVATAVATGESYGAIVEPFTTPWTINTDNSTDTKTTYTITVRAEDYQYTTAQVPGNVQHSQTYTFEIIRTAPSKNVNLSTIDIDGTQITGFSKTKYTYDLGNVANATSSINLNAVVDDTLNNINSIKLNGSNVSITPNTSITQNLNLKIGDNTIVINVLSEDGTTNKDYTVKLHRLSNESLLQTLTVTSNPSSTLTPTFNPSIDATQAEYKYTYDPNVTTISISASVKDTGKAKVRIVDANDASNTSNTSSTLNTSSATFNITTTKVNVIVTAEDGTERTYTINLERTKSTNNYLKSLSINPGTINETFQSTKGDYTAIVDADVTSTVVSAELADKNATILSITGDSGFNFGSGNKIVISTQSEDGHVNTYTIDVTRKKYAIATLDNIKYTIADGTETSVKNFNKNTLEYTIATQTSPIPFEKTTINIDYELTNEYATVTGDIGTKTLKTGNNTFNIIVTSQDGTVSNTYKLNIYRAKNSDNETKGLTVAGVAANLVSPSNPRVYEVTLPNSQKTLAPSEVIVSASSDAIVSKPSETMTLSTKNINVYTYTVTSEEGIVETYTINITRETSNNANITRINLYLAGESTSTRYCVLASTETSCTIEVPTGTTGYRLEAIIDPEATVSPANSTEYTMTTASSDSSQTRQLVVTAENNSKKTYTVTVNRAKSSNANLSAITITDVTNGSNTNVPVNNFSTEKTSYNITVPATTEDIKIEATTEDEKATITTDLSLPKTLSFDSNNQITINVRAENGTATKAYVLNITRSRGIDATLKDLKVEGTTISGFLPASTTYIYTPVAYNKTQLSIEGIANDENANVTGITVNGTPVSLTANQDVTSTVDLSTGTNDIIITVTAHDTTITKDYKISVDRALNDSTDIRGINIKNGTTNIPATVDASDPYKWYVTVPNSITEANSGNVIVTVAPGAASYDALATYTIPTVPLDTLNDDKTPVDNSVVIPVTAEDGTLKNYTLIITRTSSNVHKMTRVNSYANGSVTPTSFCLFEGTKTNCQLDVAVDTTTFTLEGILTDDKSSVTFTNGTITGNTYTMDSSTSTVIITGTVLAENGIDKTDYTIKVVRAKSSNNYLSDIKTNGNSSVMNTIDGFVNTENTYTVTVPGLQSNITISAETEDSKSKITSTDYSGTVGNTINFTKNLAYGNNTIKLLVEAENGLVNTYTITVVREKNIDPTISDIKVGGTTIDGYDKDTKTYSLNDVTYSTTSLQVQSIMSDSLANVATVTVNGNNIKITSSNNVTANIPLVTGNNTIVINTTAHDNSITDTYTINVRRELNDDVGIRGISVIDGSRDIPSIVSGTDPYIYKVTVPNSITEANQSNIHVDVNAGATADDALATYIVTTTPLDTLDTDGNAIENIVNIVVTAEDGTLQNYKLYITRTPSNVHEMTRVNLYTGTETETPTYCVFDKGKTSCTINVGVETTQFTLEGILTDPKSTVEFSSGSNSGISYNMPTKESTKVINGRVIAENGVDYQDYTITVVRAKSSNNYLSTITTNGDSNTMIEVDDFEPSTTNYEVIVPGTQDKISIHAETEDAKSTIESADFTGTPSNTIDFEHTLKYGDNNIIITVNAENGDTRTYTVKVIRQKNIEPRLNMIYINGNPIDNYLVSGSFDPDTYEYTLSNFSYNTNVINITADSVDSEYGTQEGTGNKNINTIYYGTDYTTSNEYVNNIEIKGVAHDTTVYRKYTLHIKRNANSSTAITNVAVTYDGSQHNATYDSNEGIYKITVPNSVTKVNDSNVVVTPANPKVPGTDALATISMNETTLVTDDVNKGNVNTHKFTVTAEDGTTKEYTLEITREKSNVALISDMEITDPADDSVIGSFNPTFKEGTYVYTVNVPVTTNRINVKATPKESHAIVTGDGEYDLTSSSLKVEVNVSSEDGTSSHTYTLNIVREASNDNGLLSLTVEGTDGTGYTVVPDETDNTKFKVEVPGSVSEVILNATANSALAQVSYPGAKAGTTNTYSVAVGTNNLEFKIKSESNATQSYYVEVIRKPKNDATLKSITYTLNGTATLMPDFDPTKYDYDLGSVPYGTSIIYISAATNDPDATIKIDSQVGQQTIATGPNKYIITVVAQDGETTQEYTISVDRAKNNVATLSVFSISGETFNEEWNKDVFNYTMDVEETKSQIKQSEVTAIPTDRKAQVTIDHDLVLSTGTVNYYKVIVVAEDGVTTNTYTVAITRPQSTDATLKEVKLTDATMSPQLTTDLYEYTITVPYGKTEFTIEGIPSVETSDVYTNGVKKLEDGTFTLTVVSEAGNTKVYKFNVIEAKSTDAKLSSLSVSGYPFTGTNSTFVPTTTDYTIGDIESSVEKVVVNAIPSNADSTIKYYNDGDLVADCTNNQTCEITLKSTLGNKTLTVEVTAPDSTTKKQYFISYDKVKSSDAYLTSITASAGTFDKAFNKGTLVYELSLTYDVSSVDLSFIAENDDATIKVNNETTTFTPATYTLSDIAEGETKTITVLVTAQDGITKQTYTVTVNRAAYSGSNDAFLSSLSVNGYPFVGTNTTFRPTETEYSIGQIPYALAELTINATTNVDTSKITYYVDGVQQTSNVVTIPREDATISVKVTAEDNITTKVYTINYTKKANNNAYLQDIIISGGTLDPSFTKEGHSYSVQLTDDQTSLDLTAKAEDKNSTIKINGQTYISGNLYTINNIGSGTTILNIVVTAEDGKTTQTYKVNLIKGDVSEIITSVAFGHTIEDGYIKTVAGLAKVSDVKNQLDNDNAKLQIWKADDSVQKADSDNVGTGDIVKLVIDGNVVDSDIIIILGDINGDGKHNALDVSGVINHYLKTNLITDGAQLLAADVNKDTKYNALDVSAIINHYLKTSLIVFK